MISRNDIWQWIIYAAFITCLCCVVLSATGCKSPVPTIPTNTHNRDSVRIEYKHDSIWNDRWHTIYTKGDTVYVHDSVSVDRWHITHDTIANNTTDTIYQQVYVEKKGNTFLRNSGIALWVLIALFVAGIIVGIIIKFAK